MSTLNFIQLFLTLAKLCDIKLGYLVSFLLEKRQDDITDVCVSFYYDNFFCVALLYSACMCIGCSLHLLFFLPYFVYDYII